MIEDGDRDEDGFDVFGDAMRDGAGCSRSTGHGGKCTEQPQVDVIDKDSELESEMKHVDDAKVNTVTVPKPPTDVNWESMVKRYVEGDGWKDGSEYAMFSGNRPDSDFFEGDTALSVSNADTILRPISMGILAFNSKRMKDRPVWSDEIERRLAMVGIFLSGETSVHAHGLMTFYAKIFHVQWRFFVFIILGGMPLNSEKPSNKTGFGLPILGYHYFAMSPNAAIDNRCY